MTTVSSIGTSRIQDYWKGFVPAGQAQNPILWHHRRNKWRPISYKDLNAQAHCAAAFLMARGLKKGQAVGVIARQSVDYLVLDMALQFLGAVNIVLPHDTSLVTLTQLCDQHDFRFIYYADSATFRQHGQLESLKPRLHTVMVSGEDEEVGDLDAEKVVTFDRVVGLGKGDWRESARELTAMKAAVMPNDLYTIEHAQGSSPRSVTFARMMEEVAAAEKIYEEQNIRLVGNQLPPEYLHLRTHGIFPAIRRQTQCYLLPEGDLKQEWFSEFRPQAIVTDPERVNLLHQAIPQMMGGTPAVEKAIDKARTVVDRREEALAQGKKDPFMNRMRYRTGNRKLYRRVITQLGGQFNTIICRPGTPDPIAVRFWGECGVRITGLE